MRDLCFVVDKWTSYLWNRLAKESAVIAEHVANGSKRVSTFDSFAREVFARVYADPDTLEKIRPEDAWARILHQTLDELPAFAKLRAHCTRDKEFAAAATTSLLEQIVERLPQTPGPLTDPESRRREVRGLLDFLNALDPDDASRQQMQQAIEEAKRAGKDAVEEMTRFAAALVPDDVRQALRRSADQAATEAEELQAASAGLTGLGGTSRVSEQTQAVLGQTLKSNENLKRLGMLAGRMRRLAMQKRRSRTRHAASELSDVTTGNDLARVLPHELMKLIDPILCLDFFRAFLERSLLQYELSGNEREGRGPIVVLIDDSDSMDGPPSTFAKATALALADLALADRRACRLVRFSHRLNATLDLKPGVDATGPLLLFLSHDVDGGTNFELPLRAARETIARETVYERADVILITDGQAELSAEFLAEWHQSAKRDGRRTYAVHIGSPVPPVLRALTKDVIELRALLPERLEDALFAPIVGEPAGT